MSAQAAEEGRVSTPTPAEAIAELFGTAGHPDPYPLYGVLHAAGPVHRGGATMVAVSYRLCDALLRDRRLGIWSQWPEGQPRFAGSACLQSAARALVYQDPPDHTRVRSLIGTAFSPRRVDGLRQYIRAFVADRLDEAAERGSLDLIADLAQPLPVAVVGELIGVPPADRAQCRRWTNAILPLLGNPAATDEQARAGDEATIEFEAYLADLARERRARPRDDLISQLVAADGAHGWASEAEMLSNLNSLVGGGFETTIFSIGNSVNALLTHPDQLELLRADPSLITPATEELLRFDPPLQFTTPRTAHTSVVIAGTALAAGQSLLPMLGAANRDPAHVESPDALDLRRPDPRPLVFGAGIHFCIGAALARMEIQEAVSGLISRFAELELIDPRPRRVASIGFRGFAALPIAVRGARHER